MLALLLIRTVVRNPVSTPIIGKTHEQFIKYSSASQIHENRIVKASSSAIGNDTITSVTKLLKSYEFTDPQITKLIAKLKINPLYNPTNVIRPKLDFFLEIGFSNAQLSKFISSNSSLLGISLENRMKPNILLLKSFYKTEKHLVRALMSSYSLLQSKLDTNFFPNIRILTNHGVPYTNMLKLAIQHPRTLLPSSKKFEKMVQLIVSKGFDPCSTLFCAGLHVISVSSPVTWNKKVSLYKSLGWSEEDAVSAFIRYPWCMVASEEKIKRIMDFFVNKRQFEPSLLAKNPVLINLSLEKRITPRCLVIDVLAKKQLIKKSSVYQYLISNKEFLEKYITPYQDQVPEVLHAYNDCCCNYQFFGLSHEHVALFKTFCCTVRNLYGIDDQPRRLQDKAAQSDSISFVYTDEHYSEDTLYILLRS